MARLDMDVDEVKKLYEEVERWKFACHYLAGWLSFYKPDEDPKLFVEVAYEKVGEM